MRAGRTRYEREMARLREGLPADPGIPDFLRFATLAANSHNTQPWRFSIHRDGVTILPDLGRRTPVVDPDDHHLFVSLGCAAENFLVAAAASGRPGEAAFESAGAGHVRIDLGTGESRDRGLCAAIPQRQSTRSVYDGKPLSAAELAELESAARLPGVELSLITERDGLERALEFVVAGNSAQLEDAAFVEELKSWVRFNEREALEQCDGLFSGCTGNPALPGWLGRLIFRFALRKKPENDSYARQLRSSAGIAVFTGDREHPASWMQVGRSFERFALAATALGVRTAHVNQPVEVADVRPGFAGWLGDTASRPDLVVRFGRTPAMPMSPRRPVAEVLAPA